MEGLHAQGMFRGENTSSQIAVQWQDPRDRTGGIGEWVKMPASLYTDLPGCIFVLIELWTVYQGRDMG